jgi:cytoskeleton protein RodZ
MASEGSGAELRIGESLKEARQRAGLDMRTVEERTKIRTRYLRALESEEWEALPGPAYVKGFLRTYAGALGLDADALVAEYRRTVEGPQASPVPLGEGVLQARKRSQEPSDPGRGPRLGLIAGGAIAVVVAVLLILGLTGDDDGDGRRGDRADRQQRQERREARRQRKRQRERRLERRERAQDETVTIRLVANTDGLQVCLLGEDPEQPLIDGFAGSAGSDDRFEARRFELRFPFGYDVDQFDLFVSGRETELEELQGPAAFRIKPPRRIREIDSPGSECP